MERVVHKEQSIQNKTVAARRKDLDDIPYLKHALEQRRARR